MTLSYRNTKNAQALAAYWGKPLDRADWWKVEAQTDDAAEILIYDVIGWPFNDAAELVRTLASLKGKAVTARINSPGGDVFDAVAIFNAITAHGNVTTRNESLAGSAASFLFTAGKKRQAYKNSMLMIHEPFVLAAGNQFELREIADVLGQVSENMVDMYADTSNVGKRELRDMMKAETWLNAKDAQEKGFVDTIVDGKAVKAAFDLSMYAHVPDDLAPEGRRAPTERELERALRDAGLSRSDAKALLAGRQQGPVAPEPSEIAALAALLQETTAIIGG
jgi:ATP-dependent Clp protease, protease subunit